MAALVVFLVGGLTVIAALQALPRDQQPVASGGNAAQAARFYKDWTTAELLPVVADVGSGRDWNQGRELFRKAACGSCHAFGSESEGNGLAPDLTSVGSKMGRDAILQSIVEPSATINGQFYHTQFTLKNGDVITGSVLDIVDKKIIVAPAMLTPHVTVEIAEADVKSETPSKISPMPPGLLNELTKEQVLELFAFLDSGGNRNAAVYRRP